MSRDINMHSNGEIYLNQDFPYTTKFSNEFNMNGMNIFDDEYFIKAYDCLYNNEKRLLEIKREMERLQKEAKTLTDNCEFIIDRATPELFRNRKKKGGTQNE